MNFSDEGGKLLKPGIRCEESLAPQDADDTNKPRTPLAAVTEKVWRHWKPTKQIRNLKPASEVTYAGFPVGARGKWSWANQALRAALSHGKQTSLGCQVLVGKSHSSVNILNSFMGQTGGQSSAVAKDGPMGISHSMMSAGDLAWVSQDTQKRLCMADIAGVIEEGSTVSLTAWSCQWIPAFLWGRFLHPNLRHRWISDTQWNTEHCNNWWGIYYTFLYVIKWFSKVSSMEY